MKTLEDIGKGFKIYQDDDYFRFGTDAYLLSAFAKVKKGSVGVDLCSGQGIIAFLQLINNNPKHIDAVEIIGYMSSLAGESAVLNGVADKITVHNADLRNCTDILGKGKYDFVTCNPPYKQSGTGIKAEDEQRRKALHEQDCTLEDVIKTSADLLKFSGSLYICQRPNRLCDLAVLGRKYKLELKRIRFVHSYIDKEPTLMLCELKRGASPEVRIMPPLVLYKDKNTFSDEYNSIYGGDNNER